MTRTLCVEVCNLTGDTMEIIVDSKSTTVQGVKLLVAEHWQIPPLCQELVLKDLVLNDGDLLKEHCAGCVSMSLSLVTSHARALAALASDNRDAKLEALSALMKTPTSQDDSVVASISMLLTDPLNSLDFDLKYKALKALESLAKRGDAHAIAGVSSCLKSRWLLNHRAHLKAFRSLTRSALGVLSVISPQGDETAVSAVCAVLENQNVDARLRCASLKLLSQISAHGDMRAAIFASEFLQDRDAVVRQVAVRIFTELTPKAHFMGDTSAVDAVSSLLAHKNEDVRCSAVKALTQVVAKSDPHTIAAVGQHVGHRDAGVRQTAVQALLALSCQGDVCAMAALYAHLETGDPGVRHTALWGVSQMAAPGDMHSILIACKHLEHTDAGVRQTALTALTKLASEGSGCVMLELGKLLENQEAAVREVAVKALFHVAPQGHEDAAALFRKCLRDVDGRVREAALEGLPKYFQHDRQAVLEEILPLLNDADADVKRTAAWIHSQLLES